MCRPHVDSPLSSSSGLDRVGSAQYADSYTLLRASTLLFGPRLVSSGSLSNTSCRLSSDCLRAFGTGYETRLRDDDHAPGFLIAPTAVLID